MSMICLASEKVACNHHIHVPKNSNWQGFNKILKNMQVEQGITSHQTHYKSYQGQIKNKHQRINNTSLTSTVKPQIRQ